MSLGILKTKKQKKQKKNSDSKKDLKILKDGFRKENGKENNVRGHFNESSD